MRNATREVRAELYCAKSGAVAGQFYAQLPGPRPRRCRPRSTAGSDLERFGAGGDPDTIGDQSHDGRWVRSAPSVVEVGDRVERLPATLPSLAHLAIVAPGQFCRCMLVAG